MEAIHVKKASAGDREALEIIVQRYRGYVHSVVLGIAKSRQYQFDEDLLENIGQSIWEGLIKDIKKFK